MSIRIGILGYGNLGRGVESAIAHNEDMELVGVFTRRNPENVKVRTAGVKVLEASELEHMQDQIDVLVLCGGSATDLPVQTPKYAADYNVVDSFDTHARIPEHFADVDAAAKKGGKIGIISCGWDPGMFSLNRLYANCILPEGQDYTFWGKGVSQGHSDAVRRIEGVKDARQYTIPVPEALDAVRSGKNPELTWRRSRPISGVTTGISLSASCSTSGSEKSTHAIIIPSNPRYLACSRYVIRFPPEPPQLTNVRS